MYSGITGQEFAADIYIGVVFYQRLRHMVLDKFQVRTTGPVDPITQQPVKVRSPQSPRPNLARKTLRLSDLPHEFLFFSFFLSLVLYTRTLSYRACYIFLLGSKTRRRYTIRRNGTRRAHRTRDVLPPPRQTHELLRLLHRLGLPYMRLPHLPRIRRRRARK